MDGMAIRRSGGDRGNRRGIGSAGATPEKLVANLGAVYDTTRGIVVSGGDVVTWADQVTGGTADTMTGNVGSEPQYVANDAGWPCMSYSGAQNFYTPGSSDLRETVTFSVGMWLKITTGGALRILYSDELVPQRITFRFSALDVPFVEINGGATSTYNTALTVNTWYHCCWTFDGNLAAANRGVWYINGVAVATVNVALPATLNVPTGEIALGSRNAGYFGFVGNIGDTYVGKTAWTAADVANLYNYHRRN